MIVNRELQIPHFIEPLEPTNWGLMEGSKCRFEGREGPATHYSPKSAGNMGVCIIIRT
jgi:hypothetical protein